jgi:cytochrome c-type biogenesis protein CcmH
MSLFIALAILAALLAAGLVALPLLRDSEQPAPVAATLAALVIPAMAALLYLAGSNYDWQPPVQAPASSGNGAMAPELATAIGGLEAKLAENPDDIAGWLLLGNSFLQVQRPADAESAFQRALAISGGEDTAAKLGVAEAQILASRDSLAGSAGALLEEVLAQQPDNAKALFYGGLAASARGDNALLQSRWQQLLTLNPPEAVQRIVSERLQAMGGELPPASSNDAAGIQVQVAMADGLQGQVEEGALLFLVARDGDRPGPPVAAVRLPVGSFPRTLNISDANAMIPGRTLTGISEVKLIARVSNGGDALAQPGDVFGEARWSAGDGPVNILMNQVVPRP